MAPRNLTTAVLLGAVLVFSTAPSGMRNPVPLPGAAAVGRLPENIQRLRAVAALKGHVRVIVGLELRGDVPPADEAAERALIADAQNRLLRDLAGRPLGNVTRFALTPAIAVEADGAALELLAGHPLVRSLEEDRVLVPALVESTSLIGAPSLWAGGSTGAGQAVAIVDTGVDRSHPFLGGRVVSEACYGSTSMSRFSLCDNARTGPGSADACDFFPGCDHGTQVAGIAAGDGASFKGVAPGASIIAIKVYVLEKGTGRLLALTSDVILGLERVYELRTTFNIAAVNLSMTTFPGSEYFWPHTDYCDFDNFPPMGIIDRLADAGIATIIPSGNNDSGAGIASPSCHSRAVSVGSTRDGGVDAVPADMVSPFSNSGSILKLLAPGEWIYSSVPGGGYRRNAGTSLAAAHVTGAWAVLKSRNPDAGVDRILHALRSTGIPVTDPRNGVVTPRIDIAAAARALDSGCRYTLEPASVHIGSAPASGQLRIETAGHCEWDISLTSPSLSFSRLSGVAPATINYTVTTNPLSSSRLSATMIAGQMFTVVQDPCVYDISPGTVTIGNQAAEGEITVKTEPHCPWSTKPSEYYPLRFIDGADRVGSGVARWTVPTNSQPTAREYWASVGPAYFQVGVLQAAAPVLRLAPNVNNDASVDLLWQNRTEGWLAAWMMSGRSLASSDLLSPARVGDPNWRVAAAGDVDGDGKLDLVWQEDTLGWVALWKMDGLSLVASLSASVERVGDTGWKIVAAQDFNGDSKADLVWQHQADGDIALWYMDGPAVLASELFAPGRVADTNWKIEAAADFNSDGKPDLLWRHQVEGWLTVWLMDGRNRIGGRDLAAPLVSDNWRIAAIGDLNGDNMPDLVWQDTVNGWIVGWLMDGTALMQVVPFGPDRVPDVNWRIVGPK